MNDRQRLEAIVAVVCKYLPSDGISREEAMSQIIGLVDPLPAQPEQEPVVSMNGLNKPRSDYRDWDYQDLLDDSKLQEPEQSPVAFVNRNVVEWLLSRERGDNAFIVPTLNKTPSDKFDTPLYTAPIKREWVGLTDEERVKCYEISGHYQTLRPQDSFAVLSLARAIEAKLKEKNT